MLTNLYNALCIGILLGLLGLYSCTDKTSGPLISDLYNAQQASIDRFSDSAGTLFRRSSNPNLPGPNEPINFDEAPFTVKGFGPDGQIIQYYNFDAMPRQPAPIYVLIREDEKRPVENQLNIVNVIPGDKGYNDLWQIFHVFVPDSYEAGSVTSWADIQKQEYDVQSTPKIVNCPIVPEGSTAKKRLGNERTGLQRGWYKGKIVYYFKFEEKALSLTSYKSIPISSIYVSFRLNPSQEGGGYSSGYKTESGNNLTHNVNATTPADSAYSPLWQVNVYDNTDFYNVTDLLSAQNANILKQKVATVNHPIISTGKK